VARVRVREPAAEGARRSGRAGGRLDVGPVSRTHDCTRARGRCATVLRCASARPTTAVLRLSRCSRVVLGPEAMEEALGLRAGREPFGEKGFYLEELRGRSVLVALAPRVVADRAPLDALATTIAELMRNGTRVLVWWPAGRAGTERRLLKALPRRGTRRAGARRRVSPVLAVKLGGRATWDGEALSALLWQRVRRQRLCILSVTGHVAAAYPDHVTAIATELRVPKVVLVDPEGGLVASGS